jgi:heme exporter protein CcmD
MKQDGWVAFLSMGGYGFYVWTSYALAAIAVAVEIIAVRARLRAAMKPMSGSERAIVLPDDTQ